MATSSAIYIETGGNEKEWVMLLNLGTTKAAPAASSSITDPSV